MCGITGVAYDNRDTPVDKDMLRRMTAIIKHRGPDSDGFYTAPGVGLGFRRLAIIDLATGDQPVSNEDGSITAVCNGVIYNYKELRRQLAGKGHRFKTSSDVECIVHLYEEYGTAFLEHLRGMFALALWDSRKRVLMLARDRFGIKPLYYARTHDALWFGSEQKAILTAGRVERTPDPEALRDFFTYGFLVGERSLFKDIKYLLPGHYLIYKDGVSATHRYWDMDFPPRGAEGAKRGAGEWAEALGEKLDETIRLHMRSDVEVGAWLSPGIDSSAIVSLMGRGRYRDRPLKTFTLAFEDPRADEVSDYMTLDRFPGYELEGRTVVVKNDDLSLYPETLWHAETPFTGCVGLAQMVLAKSSSEKVKVVLTGEGSDEVFGGYAWYWTDKVLRQFAGLPLALRRMVTLLPGVRRRWPGGASILTGPQEVGTTRYLNLIGRVADGERIDRLFSGDVKRELANVDEAQCPVQLPESFSGWHPHNQLQYLDMRLRLNGIIAFNLERASMAHSVEARVPFLDHELVEFCSAIPPSIKMKWLEEKHVLRRAMRGSLPKEILGRRKRALSVPFMRLISDKIPDFAEEYLCDGSIRDWGYFNPEAVRSMLKEHRTGRRNFSRLIIGVLGIQMWDEMFARGFRPDGGNSKPVP